MMPFIYKLTHIPSGRLYIGSRFGKGVSPDCFWKTYFTSSKVVAAMIKADGLDCWTWELMPRPGKTADEVFREEHDLIDSALIELGKESVINQFVHRKGKPTFFTGKHSDATKEKMSAAAVNRWARLTPEEREDFSDKVKARRLADNKPSPLLGRPSPLAGRPKSDATKAAMSRARKGKVLPHMLQPKDMTLYELVNIDTGDTVAAKQLDLRVLTGLDAQEINNLTKGRVKRSKRWKLVYSEQPLPPQEPPSSAAPQGVLGPA